MRKGLLTLLSVTLITLTGCATNTSGTDFCLIAEPIYDSAQDTPETRAQILEHNSRFECVCNDHCD